MSPISEWSRDWDIKQLDKAVDGLKKYVAELEEKARGVTGKIMPVVGVAGMFGRRYSNIEGYGRGSSFIGHRTNPETAVANATNACDEIWAEVQRIHQENIPAIENNKALRKQVELIMHNIGVPATYTRQDWGKRRQTPKTITETAGFLNDLRRCCPISDGFEDAQKAYERFKEDIEKYRKSTEEAKRAEDMANAAKEKADKAEKVRAVLVVKHNLEFDASIEDVVIYLLSQNKYLRLAHYLEKNRGDWNDGCSYAEMGLEGFIVESDIDKAIYADISSYFEEFEDGRVFRDCEWNYSRLFAIAEELAPDLYQDYQTACEYWDRW